MKILNIFEQMWDKCQSFKECYINFFFFAYALNVEKNCFSFLASAQI